MAGASHFYLLSKVACFVEFSVIEVGYWMRRLLEVRKYVLFLRWQRKVEAGQPLLRCEDVRCQFAAVKSVEYVSGCHV